MDNDVLKRLQTTELEILKQIHLFCELNDIKYSLYAGTLLGAVRHKGFIPWDDDIDIVMTRSEYSKFCTAIKNKPIKGLYFENYEIDPFCGTCHSKVRKEGTLLLQEGEDENIGHHGIWVDIFPLDKISRERKFADKTRAIGRSIVFLTRSNVKNSEDQFIKKLIRRIVRFVPINIRMQLLKNKSEQLIYLDELITDNYSWASMSTLQNIDLYRFPKEITEEYTEIVFEDSKFMTFKDYDEFLKLIYGDYLQLPPKSEQVFRHSPVKVVF